MLDRNISFLLQLHFHSFSGCPIVLGIWDSLYKCMPSWGLPHLIASGGYWSHTHTHRIPVILTTNHWMSLLFLSIFHWFPWYSSKTGTPMTRSMRDLQYLRKLMMSWNIRQQVGMQGEKKAAIAIYWSLHYMPSTIPTYYLKRKSLSMLKNPFWRLTPRSYSVK